MWLQFTHRCDLSLGTVTTAHGGGLWSYMTDAHKNAKRWQICSIACKAFWEHAVQQSYNERRKCEIMHYVTKTMKSAGLQSPYYS